jgi:NTP pyrophosphatase (non-canonical NTP hydrolase)
LATHAPWETIGRLAGLFTALDTARGISPEQQWTLQVLKLAEEVGESAQAVIGAMGTNPRKGRSHTWRHVQEEVADTAITGLVTLYRMLGDDAPAFLDAMLAAKAEAFLPYAGSPGAPGGARGETGAMAHKVFLEGGPDELPERVVPAGNPGEDVKIPHRGGYEHFRPTPRRQDTTEGTLPVYEWWERTEIAE